MRTIKFSHKYYKMPKDISDTTLYQVFVVKDTELSNVFRGYDTTYENRFGDAREYPIPDGLVLVLLFSSLSDYRDFLWTTILRWTEKKEKLYRSLMGEDVKIEIVESL